MLPREMFYATDISVTLWIVGNHKKSKRVKRDDKEVVLRDRENEILFIDARMLGDGKANDDGYVLLTEEDKNRIASTLFAWQSPEWKTEYHDIPEFCYSATMEEIRSKNYSLYTSDYVEFIDHDLEIEYGMEMSRIQQRLRESAQKQRAALSMLESAMEGINYGIN